MKIKTLATFAAGAIMGTVSTLFYQRVKKKKKEKAAQPPTAAHA